MSLADFLNDLTSGDDALAEAAVGRLLELSGGEPPATVAALQALLASSQVDWRWWAVRALAELSFVRTHSLLAQALKDPDASVRQCAALGLRLQIRGKPGQEPAPEMIEKLLPLLLDGLKDPDPLAARLVGDALGAIGDQAVPQLLELLDGSSHATRLLIVRSLAEIGDPRAIPALMAALDEDSSLMEYWANEGLEKMGLGMAYFFP